MPLIRIRPAWHLPESAATPEAVYHDRREILRRGAALAAAAALPSIAGCDEDPGRDPLAGVARYPRAFERNERYELDRPLTDAKTATGFNNFYEFTTDKARVWPLARRLTVKPWTVEVAGPAKRVGRIDFDEIVRKLPQEERLYRFRCVETWAMAVPWIGIPMKSFLDWVAPRSNAKYVRFLTLHRPAEMPGQAAGPYRDTFPYYEGLRLDEAANELTLLATGIYGRAMPNQNGAPIRLIVPWKYGFKSVKSIVRIEFVERRPRTYWNDLVPREYDFFANVDPKVPHPRWSQAQEWLIPSRSDRRPTLPYNGYGEQVSHLYRQ